ncbi:MAG: hypothetical protein K8R87_06440 [Verrucomicrobia bacterium]|nr:hypothetical protein [Verrucomicrobiota bacterium]
MKNRIQCFTLPISVIILATMALAGPDQTQDERDKTATQVAKTWFTSLMGGEAAVTTSLCAVPFSFDGKKEIKTLPELEALYAQIINEKGKRDLKPVFVKIESSSPEKVVVILTIEGDDQKIAVFVKPGEVFRVIGFRD